jgi:hypothetical protein
MFSSILCCFPRKWSIHLNSIRLFIAAVTHTNYSIHEFVLREFLEYRKKLNIDSILSQNITLHFADMKTLVAIFNTKNDICVLVNDANSLKKKKKKKKKKKEKK